MRSLPDTSNHDQHFDSNAKYLFIQYNRIFWPVPKNLDIELKIENAGAPIYTNKTGDCLSVCLSVRLWAAKPQLLTG